MQIIHSYFDNILFNRKEQKMLIKKQLMTLRETTSRSPEPHPREKQNLGSVHRFHLKPPQNPKFMKYNQQDQNLLFQNLGSN